ncbi:hypothetical protein CLOM_g13258 [Closterium sp. NIES-68]|nr:hypothetical protein CLOM_g13258 [Closterium sp. NIES-68]GJP57493.1 hypothetical protein CLOP_g12205 [Closterium sp. NIES-67]
MPFFGDQHFWAAVLHSLGVAPPALPIHRISPLRLLSSLRLLLQPPLKARALQLKHHFLLEGDGLPRAAHSFHLHLPPHLHCLLHESPEGPSRVNHSSGQAHVARPGREPQVQVDDGFPQMHEGRVGTCQQEERQECAGQEMQGVGGLAVQQEAETCNEVQTLAKRRRFLPQRLVVWKRKSHQEQASDSQVHSREATSPIDWDQMLYQRYSHSLFMACYKVPSVIATSLTFQKAT